jgi:hypothetical protein
MLDYDRENSEELLVKEPLSLSEALNMAWFGIYTCNGPHNNLNFTRNSSMFILMQRSRNSDRFVIIFHLPHRILVGKFEN